MFTASRRIRHRRTSHHVKTTVVVAGALIAANLTALAGLGASARADGFPDALQYAPMTWEKSALAVRTEGSARKDAAADSGIIAQPKASAPVQAAAARLPDIRREALPAPARVSRNVSEVRTTGEMAAHGLRHRVLFIALMTAALGIMAGVGLQMVRTLARDIDEIERRRSRL